MSIFRRTNDSLGHLLELIKLCEKEGIFNRIDHQRYRDHQNDLSNEDPKMVQKMTLYKAYTDAAHNVSTKIGIIGNELKTINAEKEKLGKLSEALSKVYKEYLEILDNPLFPGDNQSPQYNKVIDAVHTIQELLLACHAELTQIDKDHKLLQKEEFEIEAG